MVWTTKAWNITYGGKKPKMTEAKVREIYNKVPWIPDQVLTEVENAKVFTNA